MPEKFHLNQNSLFKLNEAFEWTSQRHDWKVKSKDLIEMHHGFVKAKLWFDLPIDMEGM